MKLASFRKPRARDRAAWNRPFISPRRTARQHWFIESKLHWSLDVEFREDACKIHRVLAAENLIEIRRIALNYLKGETRFKGGIRRKQKKAALDETYLADILAV